MTYSAIYRQNRLFSEVRKRALFEKHEKSIFERNERLFRAILSEDELLEYYLELGQEILLSEVLILEKKELSQGDIDTLKTSMENASRSVSKLSKSLHPKVLAVVKDYLTTLDGELKTAIRRSAEIQFSDDAKFKEMAVGSAMAIEARAESFVKALYIVFSRFSSGLEQVISDGAPDPDPQNSDAESPAAYRDQPIISYTKDPKTSKTFPKVEKMRASYNSIMAAAKEAIEKGESVTDKFMRFVKSRNPFGKSKEKGQFLTLKNIDQNMPDLSKLFTSLMEMSYNEIRENLSQIESASTALNPSPSPGGGGGGRGGGGGTPPPSGGRGGSGGGGGIPPAPGGGGGAKGFRKITGADSRPLMTDFADDIKNAAGDATAIRTAIRTFKNDLNALAGDVIIEGTKSKEDQIILERWNRLAGIKDED